MLNMPYGATMDEDTDNGNHLTQTPEQFTIMFITFFFNVILNT